MLSYFEIGDYKILGIIIIHIDCITYDKLQLNNYQPTLL
jgi:hypothetical protein